MNKTKQRDLNNKQVPQQEDEKTDNLSSFEMKESLYLEDGVHEGKISDVVRQIRSGFDYTDIYIEVEDENGVIGKIKTGFPSNMATKSTLYQFLNKAGITFSVGEVITLEYIKKQLVGREIKFTTYTDNNFPCVVNKTIAFLE